VPVDVGYEERRNERSRGANRGSEVWRGRTATRTSPTGKKNGTSCTAISERASVAGEREREDPDCERRRIGNSVKRIVREECAPEEFRLLSGSCHKCAHST